jgi:hypothetical protein
MIRVEFPDCTVEWDDEQRKCITRFEDGTEAHACPHHTADYLAHALDKSDGDVSAYCWQHDLAHCIVGLIKGGNSAVLWALAHGEPTNTPECDREEREAQEFQRNWFMRERA